MTLDALRRTARRRGIATSFSDGGGRRYEVSDATLGAVLEAMGPAPKATAWPPVVVARQGRRCGWRPRRASPSPWRWRGATSGRSRPSRPGTCRRAGTGWPAGPGPPPWWSRPAAATCRRPWPRAGEAGAGRPSCTRSGPGPAGASATSATWPACWPRRRPWGPSSPCSTRCTPPRRGSPAPTTPPAGCSATPCTCGSRASPSWPPWPPASGSGSRPWPAPARSCWQATASTSPPSTN